jgi:simple sugar transport system permease protein
MKRFLRQNEFYLIIVIVILSIIITSLNKEFFTFENLFDLLKSYSFLGILSVGILVVLIAGGIDISYTAIAQVVEYAMVVIIAQINGNMFEAFLVASVIGIAMGAFNGSLIHFFKIPAIITTIATNNLFFGLLYVFSKGDVIYVIPEVFWKFAEIKIFKLVNPFGITYGLSVVTIIWIIVLVFAYFLLRHTKLGRGIYAMGGNRISAQRAGFNLLRIEMFVYSFMGFLSGIAGLVHAVLVQSAIPNSIVGKELDGIAAVVLGGANLAGGAGTLGGTLLGVLLIAIMSNGLTLMRVSAYWYNIFIGAIVTISVSVSAYQRRQKEKKKTSVIIEA